MVYELLSTGPENGISLRDLAAMLQMDERSVRIQISRERKTGRLILSDNQNGYFKPSCAADIRKFVNSMSHRSKEIAAVSRIAEDALARMEHQETVEGW